MSLFSKLKQILFPEYSCFICGYELLNPEDYVCSHCKRNLIKNNCNICLVCGEPLPELEHYCNICASERRAFDMARSCYIYNDFGKKLVTGLKYNSRKFHAKLMAKEMLDMVEEFGTMPDIVLPVPISFARKRLRGFNQSEILALEMEKQAKFPFPVCTNLVTRTKDVPPQQKLNRRERLQNLDGAFLLNTEIDIKDKIVMIIDDVFTTGATVNELAKTLKKGRPKAILVLTFLKTALEREI